jgi:hypothetical protein
LGRRVWKRSFDRLRMNGLEPPIVVGSRRSFGRLRMNGLEPPIVVGSRRSFDRLRMSGLEAAAFFVGYVQTGR